MSISYRDQVTRYDALSINHVIKDYKVDPRYSGSRSLETIALIKNCRIQLPKPETVRISCGPRAQPALAFIVETERAVLRRAEGKPRTYGAGHDNERRVQRRREERRKKRAKVYV